MPAEFKVGTNVARNMHIRLMDFDHRNFPESSGSTKDSHGGRDVKDLRPRSRSTASTAEPSDLR